MTNTSHSNRQVVLICLVIIIAFSSSVLMFSISGFNNTAAYVERITDMTANNTERDVDYDMTTSVYAAKAMAGNAFIVDLAKEEADNHSDNYYPDKLYNYIKNYYTDNNYSFVFYASKTTETLYYLGATGYRMSTDKETDAWFYDFIKSNDEYRFNVKPAGLVTEKGYNPLLIAYRLTDSSGETLGIIGISLGTEINDSNFSTLYSGYNVGSALIEPDGRIAFSEAPAMPMGTNIFEENGILYNLKGELPTGDTVKSFWIDRGLFSTDQKFCEIRYIKAFNLYLVVFGDGAGVMSAYQKQLMIQLVLLAILLLLTITVIINTISQYKRRIISLATLDELTKIMNRKSFVTRYEEFYRQGLLDGSHIFLMDIDFFKTINDSFGHAAGDEALSAVAAKLTESAGKDGFVGRWGGDEFIGIFFSSVENPVTLLERLSAELSASEIGKRLNITLSIGVAALAPGEKLDKAAEKADIALYTSKENGRNRITLFNNKEA